MSDRLLLQTLARNARDCSDRIAFTSAGTAHTWDRLWRDSATVAHRLIAKGVHPGDRVVLACSAPDRFLTLFLGILRAAAVAVPVLPGSGSGRLRDLAGLCDAALLIVDASPAERWESLVAGRASAGRTRRAITVDAALSAARSPAPPLLEVANPDRLALLQLTSGSTGRAKAVRISHRDLATNMDQMVAGLEITERDVFVSWLPLFHDMGLILMALVPLAMRAELHLIAAGMIGIRGWLRRIAELRGTFTAAPDFAYRLALRLLPASEEVDLRSLRVALDAAEPVRASTVEAFHDRWRLPPIITPAYGLAEATVGVSAAPPGTPIRVDGRGLVSVGSGFPGIDLAILDDSRGGNSSLLAPGEIGEILVRGPAMSAGYWGEEVPGPEQRWQGWLRTGDLGYLDSAGRLFVAGRAKEVLRQGAITLAPQEIEETLDLLPQVRRSAAVGIDRSRLEGEQIFLFVEAERGPARDRPQQLARRVATTFRDHLGFGAGRIYIVAPGTIPRTANGKVRYSELRRRYLDGELRQQGAILFPEF